jgi:septal ring factor EnvC (AmiA/AmiB activator)
MNSNAVRISELASTSESQGKAISELAANVESRAKESLDEVDNLTAALGKRIDQVEASHQSRGKKLGELESSMKSCSDAIEDGVQNSTALLGQKIGNLEVKTWQHQMNINNLIGMINRHTEIVSVLEITSESHGQRISEWHRDAQARAQQVENLCVNATQATEQHLADLKRPLEDMSLKCQIARLVGPVVGL